MKKKKKVILSFFIFLIFICSAKNNGILDFFNSDEYSFKEINKSRFFVPDTLGNMKVEESDLVYLDKTDFSGFGSSYAFAYAYILLDSDGRNKLCNAANQYFSDFESKRLKRDAKKTDKIYGRTNVKFIWGTIKSQAKNSGVSNSYFGYKFKNGSPYFTITCLETENEKYDPNYNKTVPKTSFGTKYYFNKAQLNELIDFISDESIFNYESFTEVNVLDTDDIY